MNSTETGLGPLINSCEYGNKPLGPMKSREFLDS